MAVALKEGRSIRGVEAVLERPNGEHRWFEPFPTPIKDATGAVIGGINMLVDITERKRTEQELAEHAMQLALVTNIAPVYIARYDRHSRHQFVNKPYANRFGLKVSDLENKPIAEILGSQAYASLKPHIDAVLRGEHIEFDLTIAEPIRGERVMHYWYAPEFDAEMNVSGWVAAIADVTERQQIEDALRASEEKLREADRRKDEFLAMLSHELRNPLAPIANAVHILRISPAGSHAFGQARAIIERQTARLTRLVDDLLEVSRISTGRIQLHVERIAAAGIIERAIESVRPLIDQRRHVLTTSLPEQTAWLDGDSARLEQVLVNLLTNACKYTDEGGLIQLVAEVRDDKLIIHVKDNGIGIPQELLPCVFDLFTQSERTLDRSQGGLGIGLALVERLVAMHGGIVTVHSAEGQGSTFTVALPLARSSSLTQKVHEQGDSSSAVSTKDNPLRVLVVDDNIDAARSIAILLESSGHRVWTARDGMRALSLAQHCKPHVAFLDIGLPQMDGYALVKQLRGKLTQTVFVAMTGYGQSTDRDRAFASGFDDHMVKPVEFEKIEKLLQQVTAQVAITAESTETSALSATTTV